MVVLLLSKTIILRGDRFFLAKNDIRADSLFFNPRYNISILIQRNPLPSFYLNNYVPISVINAFIAIKVLDYNTIDGNRRI